MILGNNFYFTQWNSIDRMANPSLPCPTCGKYIEIVVKSMMVSQFSISFFTMHFSRFYIFIWICHFISLRMSTISLSYNLSLSLLDFYTHSCLIVHTFSIIWTWKPSSFVFLSLFYCYANIPVFLLLPLGFFHLYSLFLLNIKYFWYIHFYFDTMINFF